MNNSNDLTKKEQDDLLQEIETFYRKKIDEKIFCVCQYLDSNDGMIETLLSKESTQKRLLAGVQITIKSKRFVEIEDKVVIKLPSGLIINSSYKAVIDSDFDDEIPAVVYIYFFDVDEYRKMNDTQMLEDQPN